MEDAAQRFKTLTEWWFLTEPAFFAMLCTHELRENPHMLCPIRTGQGRIEYNPRFINRIDTREAFEELVGIEMLRLFLKHPYERTPDGYPCGRMKAASDVTLTGFYRFGYHQLPTAEFFKLPTKKHYEWYLLHLPPLRGDDAGDTESKGALPNSSAEKSTKSQTATHARWDGDAPPEQIKDGAKKSLSGAASKKQAVPQKGAEKTPAPVDKHSPGDAADADSAALWEEDQSRQLEIHELINNVKDWGSIPGNVIEVIIAGTRARVDYRRVLSGFRASVISTERHLTRMKPNRRTSFAHMGSRHDFSTNLLIAVDVSGSISHEMLRHFFSVIQKFFKYGIASIDVIQFDSELHGPVQTLKQVRKKSQFHIRGRGGTCFQPVFDYIETHRQYDGLIILTDGYADVPVRKSKGRTRILWICENEKSYNAHYQWMRKLGRVCYMNLN